MKHRALSLAKVEKYVPLARERGVSEVARSSRGFVSALRKAGSVAALPEKWQRKRDAFIERHMAQVRAHGEALTENDGTPSRRHLALIMWAYSPTQKNPTNLITREYDAVAELMQDLDAIYRPARTPKARRVARVNVEEFVGHCLEALNALPAEARKYVVAEYIAPRPHQGGRRDRGDTVRLRLKDGIVKVDIVPAPLMPPWQASIFKAVIQDLQNLDPMLADEVSVIATPTNVLGDPERAWTYQAHGREPLSRFVYEVYGSAYTEFGAFRGNR